MQHQNDIYKGTFDAYRKILKYEGARGLYKGFWISAFQVVSGVSYVTTYEGVRHLLENQGVQNSKVRAMLGGSCASIVGQTQPACPPEPEQGPDIAGGGQDHLLAGRPQGLLPWILCQPLHLRAIERLLVDLLPRLSGRRLRRASLLRPPHPAAVHGGRGERLHHVVDHQPAGPGAGAGAGAAAVRAADRPLPLGHGEPAVEDLHQGADGPDDVILHLQPGGHIRLRDGQKDQRVRGVPGPDQVVRGNS